MIMENPPEIPPVGEIQLGPKPAGPSPAETMRQRLHVLRSGPVAAPAFPVLGEIISWRLTKVSVSKPDLHLLCRKHGLSEKHIPKKVRVRSQVIRTLAELEEEGFIRKICEDGVHAVFMLVREEIDTTNETGSWSGEVKFEYDKANQLLIADKPEMQPFLDASMAKHAGQFNTRDVRNVVADLAGEAKVIRLRPEGGMWFIPAAEKGFADALGAFLHELGGNVGGCHLTRFLVPDTPEHKAEAARSFIDEFKDEYERAMAEIQEYKNAGNTRDSTITKRLETAMERRQKVEIYGQMLDLEMREFNSMLKNIEDGLIECMRS